MVSIRTPLGLLATLAFVSLMIPPTLAAGDSAIVLVATADAQLYPWYTNITPARVGDDYSATCAWPPNGPWCNFTVTFTSISTEVEVTVNGESEILEPGVAYTFTGFQGTIYSHKDPLTGVYTIALAGSATIS